MSILINEIPITNKTKTSKLLFSLSLCYSKGTRLTGCRVENMLNELQKDIPRKNYHCVFLVDGFATIDRWCFLMDFYPKNMKEVLYENGKCFHIDVVQTLARQLISAVLILRNHNIMHLGKIFRVS